MATIIETIRRAIDTCGQTRYRISKGSGVTQGQLSRLMSGERGLGLATVQKLAEYLGLEIIVRPKRGRRRKV